MTPPEDWGERVAEAEKKIRALEEKLAAVEKEREAYERGCEELRAANNDMKDAHARVNEARKKGVHTLAVNMASLERKQMRMQIAEEGLRLGTIGVQRVGSAESTWAASGAILPQTRSSLQVRATISLRYVIARGILFT